MLTTVAVENYRSLRRLVLPLGALTVVTGANGSGKSSLYKALRLLGEAGSGGAVGALAREGGLPSALWAGERGGREAGVSLKLGFAGDECGYAVDFGYPIATAGAPGVPSLFNLDPEIKRECVWHGPLLRPAALLSDRAGPRVKVRGERGGWETAPKGLRPYDSMLGELAGRSPELTRVRELLRSWRFYDQVRTDADAPARAARVGTRTPVLASDGADLAAALQTVREIGDHEALGEAVDAAFPGSAVEIGVDEDGRFLLRLRQPGLRRPLGAAELSDGTLRYLLWSAALLTPRPPDLLVLNEPESSLHPSLLAPLASLLATAARRTQLLVVTHSPALAEALTARPHHATLVELLKNENGETEVAGREGPLDEPPWQWPKR
ncbi:putative ATPase [Actinocorallia herbida]|uniref:Putative ATPase n=1 Tax=Actinocorallia herbida TaxID=58109 RepID=A0A3N1D949_9ACTN|nr:AAA family ATPase [Actinocorallia herbida]ROO90021.1 putative ATPase [Actinocorallia herbida]